MNHDAIQELLALKLYGETSAEENHEIDRHLLGCAQCRKLAAELEASLGSLSRGPMTLPVKAPAPRLHPARLAAATALLGFVAGSVFSSSPATTPGIRLDSATVSSQIWADLPEGQTPPIVTSGGRLSRLGSYLRR